MFKKHPAINRAVMVNLLSGNAIQGVLTETAGHYLILKAATVHEPDAHPASADGEVVVDAANVDFIQVLAEGR
ncbi:hypothetical protein EB72_24755 [Mycobacterium sp. SWH-M1]|nr:hypothetical protein EB72_24755 [Mycobacterium sp. SWH-M1]